jgi:P4 family phage/plasmid primase-like protien
MANFIVIEQDLSPVVLTFQMFGHRVIPVCGKHPQPYGDGQSYPHDAPGWAGATAMALALDDMVLLDHDGYKQGAMTLAELAARLGMTVDQLMASRLQFSPLVESHHFLFRWPEGLDRQGFKQANNGGWATGIDIKTGNQLVYLKPGKHVDLDMAGAPLAPAPAALLEALRCRELDAPRRPAWNGDSAKLDELKRLLAFIPADVGYDEYLTLLAGAHDEFDGAGEALELLLDWSCDAAETESKWDSFDSGRPGGVTFASVCALAKKHGADLRAIGLVSKFSAPMPVAQPVAELTPFTALKPTQLVTTGDHFLDAMEIQRNFYTGRLAQLNGAPHWWNGLHWELADMQIMRSHAAVALCGQKVTQARVSGTVAVLADHLSGSPLGEADPVNRLVHFSNASLDTETGEVRQALPLDRHTRTLAVEYAPSAKAPTWERWLSSIFDGETERIQLLQELMGWCLVRDSLGIEKAALLIGPPRSGKGTIIRVIQGLLGAAAGSLSLSQLGDGKTLSGMRGCTVAIDSDATGPSRQEASAWLGTFKRVTANEQIPIRLLYQQTPWQGALNCKILCAANRIPSSFDDSGAMATRWVPLVFDKSYLGKEDPTLAASLIKELPGIAVWALEGLARLAANRRFTMPPSSLDKLDAMIVRSSPLTEFVDDCLTLDQDARVSESAVWDAYHLWAIQRGQDAMKRGDFLNSLADTLQGRGVSRKKSVRIDGHFHRGFTGMGVGAQEVPTNVHSIAHAQKAINKS